MARWLSPALFCCCIIRPCLVPSLSHHAYTIITINNIYTIAQHHHTNNNNTSFCTSAPLHLCISISLHLCISTFLHLYLYIPLSLYPFISISLYLHLQPTQVQMVLRCHIWRALEKGSAGRLRNREIRLRK